MPSIFSADWRNEINRELAGKQPLDAALTSLAALDASPGVILQTGADTFSKLAYETGTSTPTVTAGTGTIANYTASLRYTRLGSLVTFRASISITNNGTGATYVAMTLPLPPANDGAASGVRNNDGAALGVFIFSGSAECRIFLYNATYAGGTGISFTLTGTYFV